MKPDSATGSRVADCPRGCTDTCLEDATGRTYENCQLRRVPAHDALRPKRSTDLIGQGPFESTLRRAIAGGILPYAMGAAAGADPKEEAMKAADHIVAILIAHGVLTV